MFLLLELKIFLSLLNRISWVSMMGLRPLSGHLKHPGLKPQHPPQQSKPTDTEDLIKVAPPAGNLDMKPYCRHLIFSKKKRKSLKVLQTKLRLHDIYQRLEALAKQRKATWTRVYEMDAIFPQTHVQVTDVHINQCMHHIAGVDPANHQYTIISFWDILTSPMFSVQSLLSTMKIAFVDDFNPHVGPIISRFPLPRNISRSPQPAAWSACHGSGVDHPGWLASLEGLYYPI